MGCKELNYLETFAEMQDSEKWVLNEFRAIFQILENKKLNEAEKLQVDQARKAFDKMYNLHIKLISELEWNIIELSVNYNKQTEKLKKILQIISLVKKQSPFDLIDIMINAHA